MKTKEEVITVRESGREMRTEGGEPGTLVVRVWDGEQPGTPQGSLCGVVLVGVQALGHLSHTPLAFHLFSSE